MKGRNDFEKVQIALKTTFSGLKDDPWLARKVLASAKGEAKVKKKLPGGMILAIMLVLAAAAAFAAALLWEQQVVPMKEIEQTEGAYADWPLGQKQVLLRALIDSGKIAESEDTARLFDASAPEAEQEAAADRLVLALTGQTNIGEISVDIITYAVMGPTDTWTPEQRTWWQQVTDRFHGNQDRPDTLVSPEAGVISEKDAIAIAKAAILTANGLAQDALDKALPVANLYVTEQRPDYRRWDIQFKFFREGSASYLERVYTAIVDEHGVVIADPDVSMPSVEEIAANSSGAAKSSVIQAYDEFILRANRCIFQQWSLELKAEFSSTVAPEVRQAVKDGALEVLNNGGEPDLDIIAFSSYTYGLPGAGDITQEEALTLAKEALVSGYQLDQDTITLYDAPSVYFDITDPALPLWRIVFWPSYASAEKFPSGFSSGQDRLRYRVEVDPQTKEVVMAEEFDFDALGGDLAYKLKLY